METEIIAGIAGAAISAGLVYLKTRSRYQKVKKLLKDLVSAIDDDRLDQGEVKTLIQDAKEIIA